MWQRLSADHKAPSFRVGIRYQLFIYKASLINPSISAINSALNWNTFHAFQVSKESFMTVRPVEEHLFFLSISVPNQALLIFTILINLREREYGKKLSSYPNRRFLLSFSRLPRLATLNYHQGPAYGGSLWGHQYVAQATR
jgi:hypothetical protein